MNSFQNRIKPTYYVTPNKFVQMEFHSRRIENLIQLSISINYYYYSLAHQHIFRALSLSLSHAHTRSSDKFEKQIKKFPRLQIDNQNGKCRINRYIFIIRWRSWLMVPIDVCWLMAEYFYIFLYRIKYFIFRISSEKHASSICIPYKYRVMLFQSIFFSWNNMNDKSQSEGKSTARATESIPKSNSKEKNHFKKIPKKRKKIGQNLNGKFECAGFGYSLLWLYCVPVSSHQIYFFLFHSMFMVLLLHLNVLKARKRH